MKIEDGCHCGTIAYKTETDPQKTAICHCTGYQKLTEMAFRVTVSVPRTRPHFRGR